MEFLLRVWRQAGPDAPGGFEEYRARDVKEDMSILEMLDQVNQDLVKEGRDPIVFESDCREGICGVCGLVIEGVPHGEPKKTTTCELRMRHFREGQTITIEPFRAGALPIIKDLMVDRTALDQLIQSGGYVSSRTGSSPEANTIPVAKQDQEEAMDAAECIGCGACVAACPNASAMLFTGAKVSHLAKLPQGRPEAARRVTAMTGRMQELGFGNCSNHYECQAVCPKDIHVKFISRMNREFIKALFKKKN
ncbi:MAG: succinate dehydrogenase/fumarate reductase iron-sulfur subunit [Desulfohalobiaceae bacterium]|nr:succinate dehydrogenase/fumarate reductase iron-sulfur subunit [Desulfohalobiaceae bacterium]